MADALHKITQKNKDVRIARIGGYAPQRQFAFEGIIGLLCRFAIPRRGDTNQICGGYSRHEIAIFECRACVPRIVVRTAQKPT